MSLDPRHDPIVQQRALESALAEEQKTEKPKPPKKYARSQAELIAIKQRKWQIGLVSTNVFVTILIALRTFGII